MEKIDERTLRTLVEAGTVREAQAIAAGRRWYLLVRLGMTERVLASQRRQRREWSTLDTLVSWARARGIGRLVVDATQLDGQGGI